MAEPGTLYRYATGTIVLWARDDSGLDLRAGLQALTAPSIRRIAIANPEHAPYGRAAVAALRSTGLYERVRTKLVLGESVSQAAQFVQTGNAEVGIVALSLAMTPALAAVGRHVAIPPGSYPTIDQAAIIIRASRNKPIARDFLEGISPHAPHGAIRCEEPERPAIR